MMTDKHIETVLAQIGNRSDKSYGAINTPLYFSTAYKHPGLGQSTGYDYTRTANPTRDVLQQAIAALENGEQGFATSSGMAAIQLVIEGLLDSGDRVVTLQDLYGGSYRYFHHLEEKGFYNFTYCLNEAELYAEIEKGAQLVFIETPTNPMMVEFDIQAISEKAHAVGAIVVVDNTFYTPVIQRPLEDGADVVLHSATKYIGGHNDVLGGLVVSKGQAINTKLTFQLNTTGATLDPFACWLIIRGLKTLAVRLQQHEKNAKALVAALEAHDAVEKVYYAGRGGMVTFAVKDESIIKDALNKLHIFTFAESLGGVESLITYPETQTHADIPTELRAKYGLTNKILRISTGIENSEDLVADINQAFQV
nr:MULTISPECIES: PLP-dependent transferase [Aerococcus]